MALVQQIKELASTLITEKCASRFLDELDFFDVECLKIAASKGAGIAIVAGSAIMKVPQIINIWPGDTTGLSFPNYFIESLTFTTQICYNFLNGNPVSTWGENVFLLLQNLVIMFLVLKYRGQLGIASALATCIYGASVWFIISGNLDAMAGPQALQGLLTVQTIIFAPLSRMLQIYKSYSESGTGQLSLPTQFLAAAGSAVRMLTIFQEVDDVILTVAVVVACLLNWVVLLQIVYYNYLSEPSKKKGKTD